MSNLVLFKDNKDNPYYIKGDYLYVDLVKLGITRKIGKLTYNTISGKSTLLIQRKSEQRYKFGHLVSRAVFDHFDIDKVIIVEDNNTIYLVDWNVCRDNLKSWEIKPTNGYEDQVLIPNTRFSEIRQDTPIIVH